MPRTTEKTYTTSVPFHRNCLLCKNHWTEDFILQTSATSYAEFSEPSFDDKKNIAELNSYVASFKDPKTFGMSCPKCGGIVIEAASEIFPNGYVKKLKDIYVRAQKILMRNVTELFLIAVLLPILWYILFYMNIVNNHKLEVLFLMFGSVFSLTSLYYSIRIFYKRNRLKSLKQEFWELIENFSEKEVIEFSSKLLLKCQPPIETPTSKIIELGIPSARVNPDMVFRPHKIASEIPRLLKKYRKSDKSS